MNAMGFERILGGVCAPQGFLAAGVACGIKGDGRPDLALVKSDREATVAGIFTTNALPAAPVTLTSERVRAGSAGAVVVSSGNANAMTGERGMADALAMAGEVESTLGLAEGQALVCSTGPIGVQLPMDKVVAGISQAAGELSPGGNTDAAKAIMTTDTYPKELAVEMEIAGRVVRMGAMAKGAGMIHPNMATMISLITTDMPLDHDTMQQWLCQAGEWSFNRISVDGCQSTNDTVLMMANGAALPQGYTMTNEEAELFFRALCWLTANLAMALVKDGEGATKLLRIVVNGARDDAEAVVIAESIAVSDLVKCSFFGGAPNWGRITAAAGSAGVPLDPDSLDIYVGEYKLVSGGVPLECDHDDLVRMLARDEAEITVDLGLGSGSAFYLTTDLSTEYVEINAEFS
ncbi:MAG: bifunctional glutamate N-acetyltransferase/amino-acid acetyltransferase ArgJ [Actinobacteria bacterium]|nr:bifunctional glutamate N-acetyltransferase/amino-acid acetyltransferase ArgJ [Actinomycetota bacterium]